MYQGDQALATISVPEEWCRPSALTGDRLGMYRLQVTPLHKHALWKLKSCHVQIVALAPTHKADTRMSQAAF